MIWVLVILLTVSIYGHIARGVAYRNNMEALIRKYEHSQLVIAKRGEDGIDAAMAVAVDQKTAYSLLSDLTRGLFLELIAYQSHVQTTGLLPHVQEKLAVGLGSPLPSERYRLLEACKTKEDICSVQDAAIPAPR